MKFFGIIPLLSVLLITCGVMAPNESASTGGTGSEVVGVVNYPDSSNAAKKIRASSMVNPLKHAGVFIHPQLYYAETELIQDNPISHTESDGSFRILNVLPGEHVIYVKDSTGMAIAIKISVPVDSTRINVGTLIAQKTASVQVQYQGEKTGNVLFYASVRGTGITIRCTERNFNAVLGDIPVGLDSYTVTIRILQPFSNGKDINIPKLEPAQLFTIPSFGDF